MLLTGGRVDTQRSFVGEYFYYVSSEWKVQKASKSLVKTTRKPEFLLEGDKFA